MTTGNKIVMSVIPDAVYIPTECVQAGLDSIPFVYTKRKKKQIVLLGKSNDKFVVVEKGLTPGTKVYINNPENTDRFKLAGEELIPLIKEKAQAKLAELQSQVKKVRNVN
jgi:hypothetical protein